MLKVEGLNVYYGDSQAVRNVSLSLEPEETVAVMGRNASGQYVVCDPLSKLGPIVVPPARLRRYLTDFTDNLGGSSAAVEVW